MRSYIDRAQKFIEEIYPYLSNVNSWYSVLRDSERFNDDNHRRVKCAHGISRWALINSDYVVKMDYKKDRIFGSCIDEYKVYCEAKNEEMAYLFAEITPYEYKGYTFYIMPRIRYIDSQRSGGVDVHWWLSEKENKYLEDKGLFDLHCANYGWQDNHPVLVDYAARDN